MMQLLAWDGLRALSFFIVMQHMVGWHGGAAKVCILRHSGNVKGPMDQKPIVLLTVALKPCVSAWVVGAKCDLECQRAAVKKSSGRDK